MKIAIYGSRRQYDYSDLLVRFLDELGARGCEVVMHRKLYTHLREIMPKALAPVRRVVDSPCLLYTSPSPRDGATSRMPSSA